MHTEIRNKPVNITAEDEPLFQHEYRVDIQTPSIRRQHNIFFNTEGYIYKHYSIVRDALRIGYHQRNSRVANLIKCQFYCKGYLSGPVIFIHDNWSEGYFHWHADALPKLEFISQTLAPDRYKLVLPRHYWNYPYIRDSLKFYGYTPDNIILLDYPNVYEGRYIAYCPQFAITGNYDAELTRKVSGRLLQAAGATGMRPAERLYISRKYARTRRIVNEDDVIALLERYGFRTHYPENMSYEEQIRLFAGAEWLISIHGAGLTNMHFMQAGTKVLEIRRFDDADNNCYFSLAATMQIRYHYLKGNSSGRQSDHVGDLSVDCTRLEKFLQQYL